MKKQRFQFSRNRDPSRRKRKEPQGRWVAEPFDVALLATVVLIVLWLQWFLAFT
jgi:hypothetical protein